MKKKKVLILTVITAFLGAAILLEGLALGNDLVTVPQTMNYMGKLTDRAGNPVNNTVEMRFGLYTHPSSLDSAYLLWSETQPAVSVVNSAFQVQLGAITPLDPTFFRNNTDLYLGIAVANNDEMTPRAKINSIPFAFSAQVTNQSEKVVPEHLPLTWNGYSDIDENVPENLYFHLDALPETISLQIWGEKFNINYYTELGQHSHSVDPPLITSSSVDLSHRHHVNYCSDLYSCTNAYHNIDYALGVHNHNFSASSFNTNPKGIPAGAITSVQKTYLNGMTIELNGVDITPQLLLQAQVAAFGDGSSTHSINGSSGLGPMNILPFVKVGQNKLSFKIPPGNGGGGIRYLVSMNIN